MAGPGEVQFPSERDSRRFTRRRESETEATNQVQSKVFRKWINVQLKRGSQKLHVADLFEDIKDGVVLCALVEIFGGTQFGLPRRENSPSSREHIARDQITRALEEFRKMRVKIEGITPAEVAKGNPKIVLGLIWQIIQHFQIGVLKTPRHRTAEGAEVIRSWVDGIFTKQNSKVKGVGQDWRNGRAFLALIEHKKSGLVKWELVDKMNDRDRLKHAFDLAKNQLDVPRLLQPEDVDTDHPDERSIMTYVALIRNAPETHEDAVDAASSRVKLRSGNGQRQLMDQIEKMTSNIENLKKQIEETKAKIEKYLSPHERTRESLSSLKSALSRVQPQLQQQVTYLHGQFDQQLQKTQSLSGALDRVEEQLDREEPPEAAETEASPQSIVRHLRGRLDELKARLNGSVASLQLDLTDVSQATQHGTSQSASTQTASTQHRSTDSGSTSILSGSSGKSFAWHRTEQALQDLHRPCVSKATQTTQEGDNFDLQNLLNDLRESLRKLRGLLDKHDKSSGASGGGDQTREDFVRASTEFMSSSETTCSLSACVRDSISLDKSLHEAEICLHDQKRFQQQAVEGKPNAILRQVEEHAASAERRLASLDTPETRNAYISIGETLRGQQAALHYLREAVNPPQHCVSSLQEGQQRLDRVHKAGSDLLADLQGYESPSAGASADTDQANASLQVLCDRAQNWTHDAVVSLQQLEQPLQAIRQFHENIDDPQLRSSLDKAMRDAQESERLIQDLQQPHYDLRQRRRRGQHREERDGGEKKSGVKQGQAEESPDSFLTVLGHAACLLLLLYFWSETTASLF